jgi:NAD(P)-dependent dehydrogenase (short-subunit alcohol dehydrogenase family)
MYYPGLEGKNALLIAGHSNLGQHVTKLFAQSGANVVIGARDLERAQEVAAEARKLGKGEIIVLEVDAMSADSLARAVDSTRKLGAVDVFYQGVGWSNPGPFLQLDPAVWDKTYEINFRSALLGYKSVLPIMIEQRGGCCITLSSVMGRRPTPQGAVYGAMKCALIHLSQALAIDVGQYGVRINVVAPGPTPPQDPSQVSASSNFRGMDPDRLQSRLAAFAAEIPLGRVGKPEDVAHAVLFLASPVTGGYQTGQVIGVDGGWWMPK